MSMSAVIGIILNVAALVWGAGKISQSVQTLSEAVVELRSTVGSINARVNSNTIDIEVLKAKEAIRTIKAR